MQEVATGSLGSGRHRSSVPRRVNNQDHRGDEITVLLSPSTTTDLLAQFKDRPLQANMDHGSGMGCFVVVIESLIERYEDAFRPGESTTNISSPLQDASPRECALLLRRLRQETGSDVTSEYFVMLDARTLQDDNVLMVEAIAAEDDDSESDIAVEVEEKNHHALRVSTLGAEMRLVNQRFLCYGVEGTMQEERVTLLTEDAL